MRILNTIALSAAVLALTGLAQAAEPLKGSMTSHIIKTDKNGVETSKPTAEATPGDLIEYRMEYMNVGDTTIKNLVISAPIPDETLFAAGSARAKRAAHFEVSADEGVSWGQPPLYKQTETGRVEIPASEYDLVRWKPKAAVEAGEKMSFAYRVSVD